MRGREGRLAGEGAMIGCRVQSVISRLTPRHSCLAVLFVAPQSMNALLDPVVLDGEERRYMPGVSAEAQMMYATTPPVPMHR